MTDVKEISWEKPILYTAKVNFGEFGELNTFLKICVGDSLRFISKYVPSSGNTTKHLQRKKIKTIKNFEFQN